MKAYTEPTVELLLLLGEDVLTISDPMIDDPWDNLEL